MTDAVIVSACRTAIGTAFKGTLTETTAFDLADAVVAESLARTGLAPAEVDDVILGETMYGGGVVARHAAVNLGMVDVPGLALNRHCASGLAAVSTAAANIRAGMDDVVIAGGTHSMSTSPVASFRTPGTQERQEWWISPSHPDRPDAPNRDMSITVGWNAAVAAGVTREEIDAWAFDSHRKAIEAIDQGRFADEIVPIKVTKSDGTPVTFDVDEHPRRNSTLEKLASLPPLHPEIEGFSITAGNSAGLNDGAAAVVVTSDAVAGAKGLPVLGVVRSWASVGVDPAITGLAPTKAIPKALARAGLSLDDIDLFEINEAFASMCVATVKQLGIDAGKVNPSGSGCSLGHPIAATGARMVTTLVHELRRRGGGVGVAAMCAGGGMGSAIVLEVPPPPH
jgi:acetyl-CoA C-acetyltransferase